MLFNELLSKNNSHTPPIEDLEKYKIMIVDDEEAVHKVTKLFFRNFSYSGRGIDLISAYTAKEAIDLLQQNEDTSVVLMDVVMETDNAGLEAIRIIREDLKNTNVRIVLRTGQPGVMMPGELAEKYGINDYKTKNEMTQERLYATIITALRAFDEINLMEGMKRQLELRVEQRTKELKILNETLEKRVEEEVGVRLKIEDEKRIQQEALIQKSKMAAMGEMMGAIMHQWTQPLASIALMAGLIYDDEDEMLSPEDVRGLAENITDTVQFMSSTVHDFRNFYKPNKEKQFFSMLKEINVIGMLMEKQLSHVNIALTVRGEMSVQAYGYPNEFKQVILNLVNNAKDAILSNKVEPGMILIEVLEQEDKAICQVLDNGGGIKNSNLALIFEKHATSKGSEGMGIGLSMSKLMIEGHMGGRIWVENKEDGACFMIEMKKVIPT